MTGEPMHTASEMALYQLSSEKVRYPLNFAVSYNQSQYYESRTVQKAPLHSLQSK